MNTQSAGQVNGGKMGAVYIEEPPGVWHVGIDK